MSQKWSIFKMLSLIYTKIWFDLNIMHIWGAVEFRIHLAPKYHDNSISAQSYDFCLQLAQIDTFDFTLSRMQNFYLLFFWNVFLLMNIFFLC